MSRPPPGFNNFQGRGPAQGPPPFTPGGFNRSSQFVQNNPASPLSMNMLPANVQPASNPPPSGMTMTSQSHNTGSQRPLEPQFYLVRDTGALVPLIAADELPVRIQIQGLNRVITQDYVHGRGESITCVGYIPHRNRFYEIRDITPGNSAWTPARRTNRRPRQRPTSEGPATSRNAPTSDNVPSVAMPPSTAGGPPSNIWGPPLAQSDLHPPPHMRQHRISQMGPPSAMHPPGNPQGVSRGRGQPSPRQDPGLPSAPTGPPAAVQTGRHQPQGSSEGTLSSLQSSSPFTGQSRPSSSFNPPRGPWDQSGEQQTRPRNAGPRRGSTNLGSLRNALERIEEQDDEVWTRRG